MYLIFDYKYYIQQQGINRRVLFDKINFICECQTICNISNHNFIVAYLEPLPHLNLTFLPATIAIQAKRN